MQTRSTPIVPIIPILLILPLVAFLMSRRDHRGYALQELSAPGCWESQVTAINNRQQAVGWCSTPDTPQQALLWQNGAATKLPTLGGLRSHANSLNEAGLIAGAAETRAATLHAVVWIEGHARDLGTGPQQSEARAINNQGQVAGWAETSRGKRHAMLWERGQMRDLGTLGGEQSEALAINSRGQVVGWAQVRGLCRHAFLWERGQMRDLGTLGGEQSEALAINNRGVVVGYADTNVPVRHAFRYANGSMADLDVRAALSDDSSAKGINGRGEVIGLCSGLRVDGNNGASAAFCLRGGRFELLRQLQPKAPGCPVEDATGMNDRGDIVANTLSGQHHRALLLTPR